MANDKQPKLSIQDLAVAYQSKGRRTVASKG